jgi:hypothetical protein
LAEVSVTLLVAVPPQVPELYFWALQAGFSEGSGPRGAAHLGLQWHPAYPGATAVNWGGYGPSGQVLTGAESTLPSALGNPNTRDYAWQPGVGYRLRIRADRPGWWVGEVTDLSTSAVTVVRSLSGGGDRLVSPLVWSEVFAPCDAPPVAVVWAQPGGIGLDGTPWRPDSYTTSYQAEANGGCSNSDIRALPHGVAQFSGLRRTTPPGAAIAAR